jgi:hypothetical protein
MKISMRSFGGVSSTSEEISALTTPLDAQTASRKSVGASIRPFSRLLSDRLVKTPSLT